MPRLLPYGGQYPKDTIEVQKPEKKVGIALNSYMNITVRVMTKQAQAMLANLERQLTTTSRVASTSTYGAGAAATATRSFKTFGNSIQWAGYQLLHAFTIPLLAAGGAAAKYEIANERAFANIKKVYGDAALTAENHGQVVRNELAALRKELQALSDVYGVSLTDVNEVAEAWAAAGVSGRALGKAVENTMRTMVIGDLSAAASTKALISIQAQYGASTKEMTKILNALNTTENITGATMGDLITGFGNAASVAAQAGVDYKHLAAMIAALVPAQGTAAKAGNALKTIFTDLLAPTTRAANALDAMGISIDENSWRSLTATERLELLSKKFKDLDGNQKVAASDFIAGKYQISRFAQSMEDLGKSFDAQGKYVGDNSKALGYYGKTLVATRSNAINAKIAQGELNTVLQSNPQKLRQVWTILKNEAADAVRGLIPFIIQFVTLLAGLVHWFSNLNPVVQRWVGILVIALALLGPILLYIAAISKLMHVLGIIFRTAGAAVGWFFGLFSTETRTIKGLQKDIAELRAELDSLSATTTIERLNAEFEALQAQLAALKAEAPETAAALSGSMEAATASIIANTEEAAKVAQQADYEKVASAQAAAAETSKISASVVAAETAAATEVSGVWSIAYADIVQDSDWVAAHQAAAAEAAAAAQAQAAEIAASAWALTSAAIAAAVAAAAEAAEAAVVTAMLGELAMMRTTMKQVVLGTEGWTAAGLLEAASVDRVTAALLIQLRMLQAVQAQAILNSKRMIEANSAAAGAALVPMGAVARTGTDVEKYGAGALGGAAAGERAANGKLYAQTRAATGETEGIFSRSIGKITGFFKSGFSKIASVVGIGTATAGAEGAAGLGVFEGAAAAAAIPAAALGGIVLGVIAIFLVFRNQLTQLGKDTLDVFESMGRGIWSGLKAIGGYFSSAVEWIIHSFTELPTAIVQIMKSVVGIIEKAVMEIYDLFSYINPFAHHSPSLVENVDKGMDRIGKRISKTTGVIAAEMSAAYADIKKFGKAIAGLIQTDQQAQDAANIQLLSKYAPGAIAEYKRLGADLVQLTSEYDKLSAAMKRQQSIVDAQQASVDKLNNKLDAETSKLNRLKDAQSKASDALEASKKKLEDFADAPIKGMKRMEDQIFANDQAQKKLQLQMDKMEDVIGPIDKVQAKMDALNGQIEKLKGEQASLRAGGAGSDILSAYDKQIAALEGQQGTLDQSLISYQKLQDALDELQRKGDELNLKESLKFDPMLKKIKELTDATKALPFKEIVAGIKSTQAEIDKNTKAYDDSTKAVEKQQKVVDKLTKTRDRQQKILDRENKHLDAITNKYNKIGDAIQAVTDAMNQMVNAAHDLDSATKGLDGGSVLGSKAGLKSASGSNVLGRVGGLKDQSKKMEANTKKYLDRVQGIFNRMDLFGGLKKKFGEFGDWAKKWIWQKPAQLGDWLWSKFSDINKKLGGWPLLLLSVLFPATWFSMLGKHIDDIVKPFENLGSNILDAIESGLGAVGDFFKGLPGWILDKLKKLPHLLLSVGKKLIYGLGYGIGFAIGSVIKLMINFEKSLLHVFATAGKWLYHTGIDLIKGLGHGIKVAFFAVVHFFEKLPGRVKTFFENAPHWLYEAGKAIIHGIASGVSTGASAIWNFLKNLPKHLGSFFKGAGKWLFNVGKDILHGLWNGVTWVFSKIWSGIKSFVKGFIAGFKKALGIKSPSTIFLQIGKDAIQGFLNGIIAIFGAVLTWLLGMGAAVVRAVGDASKWLYDTGKDLITGLWDGSISVLTSFGNWLGDIGKWAIKQVGKLITKLVPLGKDLISGLWNGAKNIWSNVSSWLADRGPQAIHAVGNVVMTLVSKGKDLLSGLWNGAKNIWDNVSSWLGNRGPAAISAMGHLLDTLAQKGKDLLSGFWNGMKNIWDNVKGWLGGLGGDLVHAMGDVGSWLVDVGAKVLGGMIHGLSAAASTAGSIANELAHSIVNTLVDGLNTIIPHELKFTIPMPPGISDVHIDIPLFGNIPHWNANGGIYDKASVIGVGEAGKEAVIPLTRPARALELAQKSGLLGILASQINSKMKSADSVWGKLATAGMGATGMGGANVTINNHTEIHFHGDLSFPNVKSGDDASDFISNLESLVK